MSLAIEATDPNRVECGSTPLDECQGLSFRGKILYPFVGNSSSSLVLNIYLETRDSRFYIVSVDN